MSTLQDYADQIGAYANASEIADFMEREGIQGWPCSTGTCAVAAWFKKVTGSRDIVVGGTWARDYDKDALGTDEAIKQGWASFDPVVTDFVNAFDNCAYPTLLTDDARAAYLGDEEAWNAA